ncbi:MAG TPA: dienelactone hydrolase family protein [Salinimicrobium sp.]|nr:dienelactone hydrolase family protein [Salinimicrobium sp.]
MHTKNIITAGNDIAEAKKALIMLHGRGGSAEDILSLASHLDVKGYVLLAPQATNNTWYPYPFLVPPEKNEPWLSSALALVKETLDEVINAGIPQENIYFIGFSQGACLLLEFIARNAHKYGGAVAFTGGLIGDKIYPENYKGDFSNTPVFVGTSDPDPHIPVERIYATENILKEKNAAVTVKIYKNMGHTISEDEINPANKLVFKSE